MARERKWYDFLLNTRTKDYDLIGNPYVSGQLGLWDQLLSQEDPQLAFVKWMMGGSPPAGFENVNWQGDALMNMLGMGSFGPNDIYSGRARAIREGEAQSSLMKALSDARNRDIAIREKRGVDVGRGAPQIAEIGQSPGMLYSLLNSAVTGLAPKLTEGIVDLFGIGGKAMGILPTENPKSTFQEDPYVQELLNDPIIRQAIMSSIPSDTGDMWSGLGETSGTAPSPDAPQQMSSYMYGKDYGPSPNNLSSILDSTTQNLASSQFDIPANYNIPDYQYNVPDVDWTSWIDTKYDIPYMEPTQYTDVTQPGYYPSEARYIY